MPRAISLITAVARLLDSRLYFYNHGNVEIKEAVGALAALAQETRLAVFRLLIEAGPQGVPAGQIGDALEVPPATLSFHLKELTRVGLATPRQEGRFIYYAADFERMAALMTFLTRNCCRGMPQECIDVVESALGRCCAPPPVRRHRSRS
jgi:ArsR family transcriptional regulator, arsenate/arsenite/antimonite-responsive transcriptional repressor